MSRDGFIKAVTSRAKPLAFDTATPAMLQAGWPELGDVKAAVFQVTIRRTAATTSM